MDDKQECFDSRHCKFFDTWTDWKFGQQKFGLRWIFQMGNYDCTENYSSCDFAWTVDRDVVRSRSEIVKPYAILCCLIRYKMGLWHCKNVGPEMLSFFTRENCKKGAIFQNCLFHPFGGMLAWKNGLGFWIRALKVPFLGTWTWAMRGLDLSV